MLRNKIPLCAFIGFVAIVFGLFFLSIGLLIANSINGNTNLEDLLILFFPLIGGGTLLFSGIGLLRRKNWARIVVNIILFFCFAGLAFLIYFFAIELRGGLFWRQTIAQISVVFFLITATTGLFLFLNNTRIMDELKPKDQEIER